MISIVIPTLNEGRSNYFRKVLKSIPKEAELIIVDSLSCDGTAEIAKEYADKFIQTDTQSRSARLNLGIEAATGEWIVLHHPRSVLSEDALAQLNQISEEAVWGGFTHQFDVKHPALKFTSWYSNNVRGDKKKIYYLDHCIFARAMILKEKLPLPEVDIFEDTLLCKMLKKHKSIRLSATSTTSAVRFVKNGILRQAILNQYLKALFFLSFDHRKMNILYEKKVPLNTEYDRDN